MNSCIVISPHYHVSGYVRLHYVMVCFIYLGRGSLEVFQQSEGGLKLQVSFASLQLLFRAIKRELTSSVFQIHCIRLATFQSSFKTITCLARSLPFSVSSVRGKAFVLEVTKKNHIYAAGKESGRVVPPGPI